VLIYINDVVFQDLKPFAIMQIPKGMNRGTSQDISNGRLTTVTLRVKHDQDSDTLP
jgi:hypothetical protein